MNKLTPKQRTVYEHMLRGHKAYYSAYQAVLVPVPYWEVEGLEGKHTRQVERLLALGLVTVTHEDWKGKIAEAQREHS